jgi:NADP-dependent 3-hydroxy acid dehydrogenase YdfG
VVCDGASSGFGARSSGCALAEAALDEGETVVAAARAIRTALAAADAPLRLALGGDAVEAITAHLDTVRSDLTAWEMVSRSTDLDED